MSEKKRGKRHPQGVQPEHYATLIGDHNSTRTNGLGMLHVLSDEAILNITSHVAPPKELAKLALVSKAFYCFSNHEDIWKSIVLEEKDERWEYKGSWKETYVNLSSPLSSFCAQSCLCVDHFYSDLLYQPFLCSTLDIDDAWLEEENIDRRHNLTLEEFREAYEIPNIPVIITDVVTEWPAYKKWSREFLQNRFKGQDVLVGDVPMNFDSYLQYCDAQHDEMPLYLFDKYFCEKCPEMDAEYSVPMYFEEDLFSILGKEERPDHKWLIYGPYKSGSTFHKDPNSTSAWNAVVSGAKKWILYPPHVLPPGVLQSQDGADVASPVSLMEWMISFYDIRCSQGVKPYECLVKEGELLFVPHGWWHMVINVEESCAVTQNYVSRANLAHVLNFLKSPRAGTLVSGVKTDEEKLTLYDRFKGALEKLRPDILAIITEKEKKRKRERQDNSYVKNCFKSSSISPDVGGVNVQPSVDFAFSFL